MRRETHTGEHAADLSHRRDEVGCGRDVSHDSPQTRAHEPRTLAGVATRRRLSLRSSAATPPYILGELARLPCGVLDLIGSTYVTARGQSTVMRRFRATAVPDDDPMSDPLDDRSAIFHADEMRAHLHRIADWAADYREEIEHAPDRHRMQRRATISRRDAATMPEHRRVAAAIID